MATGGNPPVKTKRSATKKAVAKKAVAKKVAPSPRLKTKPGTRAREGELIARAIKSVEERLKSAKLTPSIGDYIRLVQLQKDMGFQQPRQVTVTWIEPEKNLLKIDG